MTDELSGTLVDGDVFLPCSDGLTEHVEDAEMAGLLTQMSAQEACNALVAMTIARGAKYVTVVIVRCRDQAAVQAVPAQSIAQPQYRPDDMGDEWTLGI